MTTVASLKRRFAAMIYESLLVMAVGFFAAALAGIMDTVIVRMLPNLAFLTPILTVFLMLYAWWLYFHSIIFQDLR